MKVVWRAEKYIGRKEMREQGEMIYAEEVGGCGSVVAKEERERSRF